MSIVLEIPSPADNPVLFRCEFMNAIRAAINKAQIRGEIDAAIAVACNRALLPASPQ